MPVGKRFDALQPEHLALIAAAPVFFVATAAPGSRVNLSPKGMDSLRVPSPNRILWLNATGSGNETAAHLALDPRMTLMWMSMTQKPVILRAYGVARAVHRRDADWDDLAAQLPTLPGARQILDLTIDLVQSSCGFAVPLMTFTEERRVLRHWAEDKGEQGLHDYWSSRNRESIDGLPTGIEANL